MQRALKRFLFSVVILLFTSELLFSADYNSLYSNDIYNQSVYSESVYEEDVYGTSSMYGDSPYDGTVYANEQNRIFSGQNNDLVLIGSYAVSRQNITKKASIASYSSSYIESRITSYSSSYVGNGEQFLLSKNQASFVKNFSKWQNGLLNMEFWDYADSQEEYIRKLYQHAIAKFGAGTAVIAIPYIASILLPDGGTIAVAATIMYKNALVSSSIGAIEEFARTAVIGLLENKDCDVLMAEAVDASGNGFVIGSVTGSFAGISKSAGLTKYGNNFVNKSGKVYNAKGKLLGNAVKSAAGEYIYFKSGNTLFSFADEPIEILVRYGDSQDVAYYLTNGMLKSFDGKVLGSVTTKNGIRFIFDGSSATRPFAAINDFGQLITNDTLKKSGVSSASIATLFSDAADPTSASFYRALYAFHNPEVVLGKGDVIHHSIEQQVLTLYEGAFSEYEILRIASNLRAIPKSVNSDIHLSKIRKAWDSVYEKINNALYDNANWPTEQQKQYIRKTILDARDAIDVQYGMYFLK